MKKTNFSTRRDFWRAMIKEQKASGLTASRFCQRKGLSVFRNGVALELMERPEPMWVMELLRLIS